MSIKSKFVSFRNKMQQQPKVIAGVAAVFVLVLFAGLNSIYHFTGGHGKFIDTLIERNIQARGGESGWQHVSALRVSGQMDLGQGMHVPYVIEQKRPGKMCLEFMFNKETATQCVNGKAGWKVLPFQGRYTPEAMNESELKQMLGMTEIGGLLIDSEQSGYDISFVGEEKIDGRELLKLELSLPGGANRWLYVDKKTALEVKLEMARLHRGKKQWIETEYTDWRNTDGLLMPHRQETRIKGSNKSNFITIESVRVNPVIDDARFNMPVNKSAKNKSQSRDKKS